jgi:hypothetical protein
LSSCALERNSDHIELRLFNAHQPHFTDHLPLPTVIYPSSICDIPPHRLFILANHYYTITLSTTHVCAFAHQYPSSHSDCYSVAFFHTFTPGTDNC